MPRGRKLKAPHVDLNADDVRRWMAENGTRCEAPVHPLDDAPLASWYIWTDWSFAFLCKSCDKHVASLTGTTRTAWEIRLAEHMYEVMSRRSYVRANVASNFQLEHVIAERNETVRKIERLATTERSAAQREIRKHIKEAGTKVGIADDEILTARQRQIKREQSGAPRLGPARTDRGAVLRSKLIAPSRRTEQEGT